LRLDTVDMPSKSESIVVDSNLLLLLVVGLWTPRAIPFQKRLRDLTSDDFDLLRAFLSSFKTVVTTAHVLTEVSNLAAAASGQSRTGIFSQLSLLCKVLEERPVPAAPAVDQLEFRIFGLTDAVLSQLCSEMLLLTQDGRLTTHLRNRGLNALTLNDVRALRHQANNG
jgi:rRNA-processing protein FCF1